MKKKKDDTQKVMGSKRVVISPLRGASTKKRNVTLTHTASKKKLIWDAAEQSKTLPRNEDVTASGAANNTSSVPYMVLIPTSIKGWMDFWPAPNPLP